MSIKGKNTQYIKMVLARLSDSIYALLLLSLMSVVINAAPAYAEKLVIRPSTTPIVQKTLTFIDGQIPLSRVAKGKLDISRAWFAGATTRYAHGVLGDRIEASQLVVETKNGNRLVVELPVERVFEDLEPRLVDLNDDKTDEILVVESDQRLGASLVVYDIIDNQLVRLSATPFLGQAYRWLNPVGVGDFDNDGKKDIALIATPHIGGLLRLYHVNGVHLTQFAEYSGVSTHYIGSTELGLGKVVSSVDRDLLLVPNQSRRRLLLLQWTSMGWHIIDQVELSFALSSSLLPIGENQWQFTDNIGKYYDIFVTK